MAGNISNFVSRLQSTFLSYRRATKRRSRNVTASVSVEMCELRLLLSVTSELVADLVQHENRDSEIREVASGEGIAYFRAFTESTGHELWTSDGTSEGTTLVRDINPGPDSSWISQMTVIGSSAFFVASTYNRESFSTSQNSLWRSDGTSEGTQPVTWADGSLIMNPAGLLAAGGELYFWASASGGSQRSLYRIANQAGAVPERINTPGRSSTSLDINGVATSNTVFYLIGGTGNTELFSVQAGQQSAVFVGGWHQIWSISAAGDQILFRGTAGQTSSVWITNGTVAGTVALPMLNNTTWNALTELSDGRLMFVGQGQFPDQSRHLWISDGTYSGTARQFSLPGSGPSYAQPNQPDIVSFGGGRIAFFAGGEVWQTDGTLSGTIRLTDYNLLQPRTTTLVPFGDSVLLNATSMTTQQKPERWYRVGGDRTSPVDLGPVDNRLRLDSSTRFFPGPDFVLMIAFAQGPGVELWSLDGTGPFELLRDINPSNGNSFPNQFVTGPDRLFFSGESLGAFYESDGIHPPQALPGNKVRTRIITTNSEKVFRLDLADGASVRFTNTGTWQSLQQVYSSVRWRSIEYVEVVGDRLYFLNRLDNGVRQLWVTDGTANGTFAIRDQSGAVNNLTEAIAVSDTQLVFHRTTPQGQRTLWVTDGTVTKEVLPGVIFQPSASNSENRFHRTAYGVTFRKTPSEIWVTDGTSSGTRILFDGGANFVSLIASSETYTFFSEIQRNGQPSKVWRTDGTTLGTVLVGSMPPTGDSFESAAVDDVLFVVGINQLWSLGRNGSQTTAILEISSSEGPSGRPTNLFSLFGKLFFVTDSPEFGRRLWTSNGTVAGTYHLQTGNGAAPAYVVSNESYPYDPELAGLNGELYYQGVSDVHGVELMRLKSDVVDGVPGVLRVTRGPNPGLQWREVFGAVQYELAVTLLGNDTQSSRGTWSVLVSDNKWEIPKLFRGEAVSVRVRGISSDGTPGDWNPQPLVFTTLDAPRIHSIPVTSSNSSPVLSWASPAGSNQAEVWLNDLDSKQRILLQRIEGGESRFQCPELPPSRYAFWVRTFGANGTSRWSDSGVFTILAPAPRILSATADSSRKLTVAWSAVDGATDYEIQIHRQGISEPYLQLTQTGTQTSWTSTIQLPGDEYIVSIRARRPGRAFSEWSDVRALLIRQAPVFTVAFPVIRWGTVGQATQYELVVRNLRSGIVIAAETIQGQSFQLNQVPLPGVYEIQMRSIYNERGSSEWRTQRVEVFHPEVSIITRGLSTVDATPVIRWTPQDTASGYEIYVARKGSPAPVYRRILGAASQHRIEEALAIGNYQIWIRSYFPDGSRSLWGSGTDLSIGTAPQLAFSRGLLQWNAVDGATRYEVVIHLIDPLTSRMPLFLRSTVSGSTQLALPEGSQGRFRAWVRALRNEDGAQYVSIWSNATDFAFPEA